MSVSDTSTWPYREPRDRYPFGQISQGSSSFLNLKAFAPTSVAMNTATTGQLASDEKAQRCDDDIMMIRGLEEDWDGGGAFPISEVVIRNAEEMLTHLKATQRPLPDSITPSPDGSIYFGWMLSAGLHEYEISDSNRVVFYTPSAAPRAYYFSF